MSFKVLDNYVDGQGYTMLGRFYAEEEDGSYTAIDNTDGNAWTEPFVDEESAIYWLESGISVDDMEFDSELKAYKIKETVEMESILELEITVNHVIDIREDGTKAYEFVTSHPVFVEEMNDYHDRFILSETDGKHAINVASMDDYFFYEDATNDFTYEEIAYIVRECERVSDTIENHTEFYEEDTK